MGGSYEYSGRVRISGATSTSLLFSVKPLCGYLNTQHCTMKEMAQTYLPHVGCHGSMW